MWFSWVIVFALFKISRCTKSNFNVTIGIQLDSKPEETGFSLIDLDSSSQSIVAQRHPGYFAGRKYQYVEESFVVNAGSYAVSVSDSGNDGSCSTRPPTTAPSSTVREVPCSSQVSEFTSTVLVVLAGDATKADDEQLNRLGDTFASTYNNLNSLNEDTCDPFFRIIDNANVQIQSGISRRFLAQSTSTSQKASVTKIPAFFYATGTCRLCKKSTPLFNDATKKTRRDLIEQFHRSVASSSNDCVCHAAATFQPPSPDTFVQAFTGAVETLIESGALSFVTGVEDLVPLDPVSCDSTVSAFTSYLVMEIDGDPSQLSTKQLDDFAKAVTISYNNVNGNSEKVCDPQFRVLDDGVVSLDSNSTSSGSRLLGTTKVSSLVASVKVVGTCRGCKSSTKLYNDASSSGKRSLESWDVGRYLEGTPTKGCYCPPNAEMRLPTLNEFSLALNETIQSAQAQGFISFVASVGTPLQLLPINCGDPETFTSTAVINLVYDEAMVDESQLDSLGGAFISSYNTVNTPNDNACDPFSRNLGSAQIDIVRRLAGTSSSSTKTGSFTIKVVGTCRGCKPSRRLFNDVAGRMLSNRPISDNKFRHLQSSAQDCFCPAGSQQRAPSSGEFQQAFVATVDELTQQGVLTFVTSILGVENPPTMSPTLMPTHSPSISFEPSASLAPYTMEPVSSRRLAVQTPSPKSRDILLKPALLKPSSDERRKIVPVPMNLSQEKRHLKNNGIQVTVVSAARTVLSVDMSCDFGASSTIPLPIPAPPTEAPSISMQPSLSILSLDPNCHDSRGVFFDVPPLANNKTCNWLAKRLDRNFPGTNQNYKDKVCVASNKAFFACQASCGTCQDYFVCADYSKPVNTSIKVLGIKSCAWLSNVNSGGKWRKKLCVPGQNMYNRCLQTCGVCDKLSRQTFSPSSRITMAPFSPTSRTPSDAPSTTQPSPLPTTHATIPSQLPTKVPLSPVIYTQTSLNPSRPPNGKTTSKPTTKKFTSRPTSKPTRKKITRRPTSRPTHKKITPRPTIKTCGDNPRYRLAVSILGQNKTCNWLLRYYNRLITKDLPPTSSNMRRYRNATWGSYLCNTTTVSLECRGTCGKCKSCVDNRTATFPDRWNPQLTRNCTWLQSRLNGNFRTYCSPGNPETKLCRKTCQRCGL